MPNALAQKRIAALFTDGVEQIEFTSPRKALEKEGAIIEIISLKPGEIKGWDHDHWDQTFTADKTLDEARLDDYDALLLPGGAMNPDKLRQEPKAVAFVKAFADQGKPIAAICHAPWMLAEAGLAQGRKLTSFPSIQTDLKNAGADWVDEEVVVDRGIVTSRSPKDLEAFNRAAIETVAKGLLVETSPVS